MAVGCSLPIVQLQQISSYCEDFKMSQHFTPFKCVLWCVLGLPWMDSTGVTHCLPMELNHPELPSPPSGNISKALLPPPQAAVWIKHVFPWWHEFFLVTFWLLGLVFSILNLLNECTWKVFSLFVSVFMSLGCSFYSSPPLLLSLSAATNNIPHYSRWIWRWSPGIVYVMK